MLLPGASTFAEPFLNLQHHVYSSDNNGLFGMAFHKDFTRNGRLFIGASCKAPFQCKKDGDLIVNEYYVSREYGAIGNVTFKRQILYVDEIFPNNRGGQVGLLFGSQPAHCSQYHPSFCFPRRLTSQTYL